MRGFFIRSNPCIYLRLLRYSRNDERIVRRSLIKFYLSVFKISNSAATPKMMHVEDGFSRLRKSLLRLRGDGKLLHNCRKRKMFAAKGNCCCRFLSFPFYITAFASETGIPIRFGIFIKILFHYCVTGIKKGTAK